MFILIVLLYIIFVESDSTNNEFAKLSKRRLLKEYRDAKVLGYSFLHPFNETIADDIGIRLHPTKNLFEWHFSFSGTPDSVYDGGVYHGKIFLPPEYPRKAPSICVTTPNGRWETNKLICLSATAHHPETWDTNWNLRTLVMALRGHMLSTPLEIAGISTPVEHRQMLAKVSRSFFCPTCGIMHRDLLDPSYNGEKFKQLQLRSRGKGKTITATTGTTRSKRRNAIQTQLLSKKSKEKTKNTVITDMISTDTSLRSISGHTDTETSLEMEEIDEVFEIRQHRPQPSFIQTVIRALLMFSLVHVAKLLQVEFGQRLGGQGGFFTFTFTL